MHRKSRLVPAPRTARPLAAALALALAGVPAAQAAPLAFCARSSAELDQAAAAIAGAGGGSGTDGVDLRITGGTFTWPERTVTISGSTTARAMLAVPVLSGAANRVPLRVSGQWNADCSAQLSPNSTATIIDGLGTQRFLTINRRASSTTDTRVPIADVQLDQLYLFRVADRTVESRLPGTFAARNLRFVNGTGSALNTSADEQVRIRNSVFEGYTGTGGLVYVASSGIVEFQNNTLRDNTMNLHANGLHRGLLEFLPSAGQPSGLVPAVENNIFHGNSLCATYCHDTWSTILYRVANNIMAGEPYGPTLVNLHNVQVDPQFANAAGPALEPGSPARDLGDNAAVSPGDVDYYGGARIVNGVVDLGADELPPPALANPIFANSFE